MVKEMKVWVTANQKGGVGKTVVSTNLAVHATLQGEKMLLIDLDPQQSSTKWWEARENDEPILISCKPNDLKNNIEKAKEKDFSLVIIDTAGKESLSYNDAIDVSTFCIVPCQPSKDDIRSTLPIVETIKSKQKNFAFVITRCPSSGSDGDEAKDTLSTIGLVCKTYIKERKSYKRAYANEQAVIEFDKNDKGANEIAEIYQWICNKERRLKNAA